MRRRPHQRFGGLIRLGLVRQGFLFDLSDGSSVHVTTAKWLTPKGRTIDGTGLTPDVVVRRAEGEPGNGIDSQLDRALEALRAGE